MVMKEGSIEVQGLRVEYEEYTREGFFSFGKTTKHMPLQEIDLKVKNGDRVAVIGRNGSGKSTLLLSLAGFLRPERGSIHTKGRTLFLAGVDPGFSPELTGRENITDLAPAYGIPGHLIEKFTESVKDFAELGDNFERKYGNYSSGMKGKLGFGFVSNLQCDILLIDEVFGAGDRDFKAKAKAKMEELIDDAATVVMCTHSLSLALDICNRCIILEEGRMVFEGGITEGVDFYKSLKKELVDWIELPYTTKYVDEEGLRFNFKDEFGVDEDLRLVVHDNLAKDFVILEEIGAGRDINIGLQALPGHLDCKFKVQQLRFGRWYDASNYTRIALKDDTEGDR